MSNAKELLRKGSLALAANTVVATAMVGSAQAACTNTTSISGGAECAKGEDQSNDLVANITTVTNTMLFGIGIVAVIMLIIGGFRYILAGGNTQNVTAAKDTILYAVIGIVVALLAYAIVNFVLGQFGAGGTA